MDSRMIDNGHRYEYIFINRSKNRSKYLRCLYKYQYTYRIIYFIFLLDIQKSYYLPSLKTFTREQTTQHYLVHFKK